MREILNELRTINVNIEFIKEHMIDADTILMPEEEEKLNKSVEEFRNGKTTPLIMFKRED